MSDEKNFIKEIASIMKETEKEIKEIYENSSFDKPIKGDVILSLKSMSYEKILAKYKKYRKEKK